MGQYGDRDSCAVRRFCLGGRVRVPESDTTLTCLFPNHSLFLEVCSDEVH